MWKRLYDAAVEVQNGRQISPFIDAGGVAAAILMIPFMSVKGLRQRRKYENRRRRPKSS